MKKIYRRVLAMGLSLALAVTSVPTAAFAVEHVEAEDAVVLPEENEHIETAPEQADAGDASTGDVTVEGIETTGSADQTAAGETAEEAAVRYRECHLCEKDSGSIRQLLSGGGAFCG